MSNPLSREELRSILNDATDVATLSHEFVTDLGNLFDAIHAITDRKPEAGVHEGCHRISTVQMSCGLAKIGSYLADSWTDSLNRTTGDLQEKIAALKEEQRIG